MEVTPTGGLILCRYLDTEDTLPGGKIHLLDRAKQDITAQQGIVESVGPGYYDEDGDFVPMDPDLTKGTWILHRAFARREAHELEFFLTSSEEDDEEADAPLSRDEMDLYLVLHARLQRTLQRVEVAMPR